MSECSCKLLLERGVSVEALKDFISGIELLDQSLEGAMDKGTETTLGLLG